VKLPLREKPATLDVLVDLMGRVNFGVEVHDRKGIHAPTTLTEEGKDAVELKNWKIFRLPLDAAMLETLHFEKATDASRGVPGFWRATIKVDHPGDCFLDMRPWGKGFAWVNGHNLGRYWNIGPQQTMYVPGPWLNEGENEVVILDFLGPEDPIVAALDHPILDQLRPKLDFSRSKRRDMRLNADFGTPAQTASFAPGSALQEVHFAKPATGRYFGLEALSSQDGKPVASIAELTLLDTAGRPLSTEGWTIAYVDSEERESDDGTAENAIDGQTANYWQTESSETPAPYPHRLILDMAQSRSVGGFRYVPRQGPPEVAGRIKDYRVFVSDDLIRPLA
jgi:beta-galactosidase